MSASKRDKKEIGMMSETNLSIYDCNAIIQQIDALAEANQGEITDEQLEKLVQAQTTSMVKLAGLCGFIKFIEHRIELCKEEEDRIAKMRKMAERRLKSIGDYLVPFVADYRTREGHPLSVGTFTLSTRKSESVQIADDIQFAKDYPSLCVEKTTLSPNKATIKEAIKAGEIVSGAEIVTHTSLQLK
jgi:hypothetical protein